MHIIVLIVGLLLSWLLIGAWLLLLVGARLLLLVGARLLLLVGAWCLLLLNVHRHEFRFRIDLLVKQWLLVGWDFDMLF